MVAYSRLKYAFAGLPDAERDAAKLQTLDALKRLRAALRADLPGRTTSTLMLGTWNIRNFDDNRFGHGTRLEDSLYYIAEVISAFDVIAIQEVCEDLTPFTRLMSVLGPEHDFLITDVTEGDSGNRERLGFIYNKSKVRFTGVAGEIVLPFDDQISDVTKARQFARTPFACTFQAGWFKFSFATVHIYYGADGLSTAEYARRVAEIDGVAKFIAKRAKADKAQSHVLVGDFNIEDFGAKTFDALAKHGFQVFRNKQGSNAKQNRFYDQISFIPKAGEVQLAQETEGKSNGVFNLFKYVFRDEDFTAYRDDIRRIVTGRRDAAKLDHTVALTKLAAATSDAQKAKAQKAVDAALKSIANEENLLSDDVALKTYYLDDWRTFQMSDHFPLFVELKVDFTETYLDGLREAVLAPE
ncbi:endonuclease/exonuclease/phosphatase family protein [Asticcacaulis sp. BYS171W]|uniref:Endonuclease/exonuclease/phosphatase family protein n=1 Tax=Asticcacaulis aquaticus TaxID=2984212 RepID=A0ABT5HPT7_9CAUL|nr:endonuclease/exonuclease/phosphatase family protein [Asticcacaulis aquaticus]MDC7682064.1 endonuclease/exonuclease/phosphatase family protein [Asticcacaulis aquaticus]